METKKIVRKAYTWRIPKELGDKVAKLAWEKRLSQTKIIEEALQKYFAGE